MQKSLYLYRMADFSGLVYKPVFPYFILSGDLPLDGQRPGENGTGAPTILPRRHGIKAPLFRGLWSQQIDRVEIPVLKDIFKDKIIVKIPDW